MDGKQNYELSKDYIYVNDIMSHETYMIMLGINWDKHKHPRNRLIEKITKTDSGVF